MGQGDKPQRYVPTHSRILCAVTRVKFNDCSMRPCPHEAVQRKYGAGCNVSVYVCRKCQHGVRHELFDGWGCSYGTK